MAKKYNISLNSWRIRQWDFYMGLHDHPRQTILSILYKRKEYLFISPSMDSWGRRPERDYKLEMLDCHTGEDEKKDYCYINNEINDYLRSVFVHRKNVGYHGGFSYLNVQKCRTEIERINKLVEENGKRGALLKGF